MHPSIEQILQWFEHKHLQEGPVQVISLSCGTLARTMAVTLQHTEAGPELAAGLRHLLEAKDCFVRAAIKTEKWPGIPDGE